MNIVLIYTLTYMILLIRIIFTIPHYPHYSYYPYSDLYASLLMFMDFHKFLRIHTDLPYMCYKACPHGQAAGRGFTRI